MAERKKLKVHETKEYVTAQADEQDLESEENGEAQAPSAAAAETSSEEISEEDVLAEGRQDGEEAAKGASGSAAEGQDDVLQGATSAKETLIKRKLKKRKRNRQKINEERRDLRLIAGMIFLCNAATKRDCFKYRVFGFPEAKKAIVQKVKKGMRLFLFDIDRKVLLGIYSASSDGGMNLEPEAFQAAGSDQSKFPAQVRFHVYKDCVPLQEREFRHAIKDNYFHGHKFKCDLSSEQVGKLMRMFRPLDDREFPRPQNRGRNAGDLTQQHMRSGQNAPWPRAEQSPRPASPRQAFREAGGRISARENYDPLVSPLQSPDYEGLMYSRDTYAPFGISWEEFVRLPAGRRPREAVYAGESSPHRSAPVMHRSVPVMHNPPQYHLPPVATFPWSEPPRQYSAYPRTHDAAATHEVGDFQWAEAQAEALYRRRLREVEADVRDIIRRDDTQSGARRSSALIRQDPLYYYYRELRSRELEI